MSSEMLGLSVQQATRGSQLQGSHVLPIQVDFSIERNVDELRKLLYWLSVQFSTLRREQLLVTFSTRFQLMYRICCAVS
ncbi:hypothetical protein IQ277_23140 [Nostocales cyanobacterium LEGE 12452]|nr:hypothetical protein [Nostocales cyanobacterium LEGE 12452]